MVSPDCNSSGHCDIRFLLPPVNFSRIFRFCFYSFNIFYTYIRERRIRVEYNLLY